MLGQSRRSSLRARLGRRKDYSLTASSVIAVLATFLFSLAFGSTATFAQLGTQSDNAETTDVPGTVVSRERGSGVITVDALLLRRSSLQNVPFTRLGDAPPAATSFGSFTSSELERESHGEGLRATVNGNIFDQRFEFSGFYMGPINYQKSKFGLATPNNTDAIYDVQPATPANTISSVNSDNIFGFAVQHQTKLLGGEANAVGLFGIPGLTVGARAIYFGEELGTTTMDQADDLPGGSDTTPDRDHVNIRTSNTLVGVQLGLQHMFNVLDDKVRIGGSVKAGLFNNFVSRRRTFVSENRPDLRSFENSDSGSVFSQGVEINPRLEIKLTEGVYLSAAGSFLWLNNVSEALPHFASVANLADTNLRSGGDVFFYGGSLGVTIQLDGGSNVRNGSDPFVGLSAAATPAATVAELDERVAELEAATARTGNRNVSLGISGHINRMLLAYNDGAQRGTYIVDNVASRSRLEFNGAAKIARGWSAGYYLSLGLDDQASNDVSQTVSTGDGGLTVRHSAWWIRSNAYGTVTLGQTSSATDDIILNDVGGIMPGAQNISTIGGSFIVRSSDSPEQSGLNTLITRTSLDDFAAGSSVDTLRRNVVRYDLPRIQSRFGNVNIAAAIGEDDFWDASVDYSLNYNDWKFRFGAGYFHDTSENGRANSQRDREEYKGSASLLHVPSGLFGTVSYVRREFNGRDTSDQAVFGENTVGLVTPSGTNRPPIDYLYTAFGIRQPYSSIGETSVYGEYAKVDDAISGLREADLDEVTDSRLQMFGAAISQRVDAAAMDVYVGFRYFTFDVEGVINRSGVPTGPTPSPINDIAIGYAGARIQF